MFKAFHYVSASYNNYLYFKGYGLRRLKEALEAIGIHHNDLGCRNLVLSSLNTASGATAACTMRVVAEGPTITVLLVGAANSKPGLGTLKPKNCFVVGTGIYLRNV